jgi:hypothetical protein
MELLMAKASLQKAMEAITQESSIKGFRKVTVFLKNLVGIDMKASEKTQSSTEKAH